MDQLIVMSLLKTLKTKQIESLELLNHEKPQIYSLDQIRKRQTIICVDHSDITYLEKKNNKQRLIHLL